MEADKELSVAPHPPPSSSRRKTGFSVPVARSISKRVIFFRENNAEYYYATVDILIVFFGEKLEPPRAKSCFSAAIVGKRKNTLFDCARRAQIFFAKSESADLFIKTLSCNIFLFSKFR